MPVNSAEAKWIQTDSLYQLLNFEPFLLLTSLVLLAWVFYKGFLRGASDERHRIIRGHLKNIFRHYLVFALLYSLFLGSRSQFFEPLGADRLSPYMAVLTFFWGGLVFVTTSRLVILQYLFLGSMRAGVPLLIVNIFSLGLSLFMILWGASQIFSLNLGPLLATSAAFSVILGLALQDTLGNLFAGIALQLDHNFEIGDWVEVFHNGQKTVGQVKEMTWRTTTLIGWTEEVIVLPNRLVAGSQIANFQAGDTPFIRSQIFRLPYGADLETAKKILLQSLEAHSEIRKYPEPLCLVTESTEHFLSLKLVYYVNSYGSQFVIGDRVLTGGWAALEKAGFSSGRQVVTLVGKDL